MNKSVVIKFLTNKLITYSTGWNTVNVALCQPKEAGGEHIHLNPSTGDFYCSKCNKMSEWSEFKNLVETNRMTGPCPVEFKKLNLKEIGASVKTADLNSIKNYAGWANSKKVRSLSDLEFRIFLKNCGFHTEVRRLPINYIDQDLTDCVNFSLTRIYSKRTTFGSTLTLEHCFLSTIRTSVLSMS